MRKIHACTRLYICVCMCAYYILNLTHIYMYLHKMSHIQHIFAFTFNNLRFGIYKTFIKFNKKLYVHTYIYISVHTNMRFLYKTFIKFNKKIIYIYTRIICVCHMRVCVYIVYLYITYIIYIPTEYVLFYDMRI